MQAHVELADARLLDHCAVFGRWLDESARPTNATGRLGATLDERTLQMLRRGLGAHPQLRGAVKPC